jgi:hypothetical protein
MQSQQVTLIPRNLGRKPMKQQPAQTTQEPNGPSVHMQNFHPTALGHRFFSRSHKTISRVNCMPGHKTVLKNLRNQNHIKHLSSHNAIGLEGSKKWENPQVQKLNNTLV